MPKDWNQAYQDYAAQLAAARTAPPSAEAAPPFDRLLMGDVSGIQKFIFNVKSKGASRTLKARSLFIQVLSALCVAKLRHVVGEAHTQLHYAGGGNFWLYYDSQRQAALDQCLAEMEQALVHETIAVHLVHTRIAGVDFDAARSALYQALHRKKQRAYAGALEALFTPFLPDDRQRRWRDFTRALVQATHYCIAPSGAAAVPTLSVDDRQIELFGMQYRLCTADEAGARPFGESIRNKLPKWTEALQAAYPKLVERAEAKAEDRSTQVGNVVAFEDLADMAAVRTGTSKLGILKLDIDDLGELFRGLSTAQNRTVSRALTWFFDAYLNHLLDETFEHGQEKVPYRDQLYVVFSGGDDCFLLGAWDAVFEFAGLLQARFDAFINTNPKLKQVTLSAGILVVDRSFPVVRFAELVEDALHQAKFSRKGQPKNKLSVFNLALTWKEWQLVRQFKKHLLHLMEAGESKSFLNRIKKSTVGFAALQEKGLSFSLHQARVWRFNYYIRNVKKENLGYVNRHLVHQYERILLDAITTGTKTDPAVFPVAARWTELLTRKQQNN